MYNLEYVEDEIYRPWELMALSLPYDLSIQEVRKKRKKIIQHYIDTLYGDISHVEWIPVVGTVGKGTTAHIIHRILPQSALLTSPHVYSFDERILLPRNVDLLSVWNDIKNTMFTFVRNHGNEYLLGFQEAMLLLFIGAVLESRAEYAVAEAARGGGSDPVSLLPSRVGVITTIDYDHTHIFGNTISNIAREKLGIMRDGMTVFTPEVNKRIEDIFKEYARFHGSSVVFTQPYEGELEFPMSLEYNRINTGISLAVAEHLGHHTDRVPEVKIPGRMEIHGNFVMDIAHNPRALRSLITAIEGHLFPNPVYILGFAMEKDHREMLRPFRERNVVITRARYRGMGAKKLQEIARETGINAMATEDQAEAIEIAENIGSGIVITGSTYLVADMAPLVHARVRGQ